MVKGVNSIHVFLLIRRHYKVIGYYDELEVVNPTGTYISRHKLGCLFFFSQCVLRDPENHFNQWQSLCGQLTSHNSSTYGVNRLSILENVPGFSVTKCLPHDILHDLFEGVVPLELKFLPLHSVQQKFLTIPVLNHHLSRFDYERNKPSLLDDKVVKKDGTKMRQSASQMMSLQPIFSSSCW